MAEESGVRETAVALAALRAATADLHANLEAGLPIARPHAGRAEYAAHIAAMHGWLAPFEASLWRDGWPREIDAAERARKREWLEADIAIARADGFLAAPLQCATAAPSFDTLAQRIGWAYGVEGSTLGGRVLLARLQRTLHPWPARFLVAYGHEGAGRWRDFLGVVERKLSLPGEIDEASRAAAQAFQSLDAWFRWSTTAR